MAEGKGKARQQNEGIDSTEKRTENGEDQNRTTSQSEDTTTTYAQPVKPITMWQAPQSLLHPTAPPLKQVSQERKETYFRRVAMPERYEGPPPARWQRRMQVAGGIFSAVVGVYIVLFHDYGPREHVFSPIRRLVGTKSFSVFQLSDEEKVWAQQRRASQSNNTDGTKRMV
ncbi:uncharacterized protein FA14DRAFT_180532 [Meira miltonrushii]|uniref:Transmembrane protein n=1 Tax=Meira miltonrushii TaxID=1280837 RepID=A0A316VEI7_9BASI|nr:uncharacterized protein FA14DRAFT_180532 [Meira miltonrushii]PWN33895.1 hypothetical protein FA14DRAFT_180532 [Meira miltonrushii]